MKAAHAMPFSAYMLRCADDHYYVGSTDNLELRVSQHQAGAFPNCYTFKRRPVLLVWSEAFPDRLQAKEAESRLKGWSRAKKEALMAGDWGRISTLAQNRQGQRR
jgi:predicted GIY-YIG superfamily endonuclease